MRHGEMETEELLSINVSPLVTDSFAVQWSPDNQISIITERGVHIFELKPTPMCANSTLGLARSFINPPDAFPAYAFAEEINSLIWKLERKEIYSLLMEEMITPKLNDMSDRLPRIVKVAWSPKNLISPSQCVLAIVTAMGTVELLHKVSNEWYSICNVSSHWLDIVQDDIKSSLDKCKTSNDPYTTITKSMRQLQACSVTWSKIFVTDQTSFAYLSVAYYSGDIAIWKIPRITDYFKSLRPTFVGRVNSNVRVKINVLHWFAIDADNHLLVIGHYDGRIRAVKLTRVDDDLQAVSTEQYVNPDCIAVDYLDVISRDGSGLKILATKGFFLLLLCVDLTKGVLENTCYLQIEGFNITGITSVAPQRVLITTQDGRILAVDARSHELVSTDVKSHLPQTRVQHLGLAHSPNKVIFLTVTSPDIMYDHLIVREPSVMHMFSLKGTTWDPWSIIDNGTNLADVWDCMEVLRLRAVKAEDPTTVLRPSSQMLQSPLRIYNLQVSMWMAIMTNVSTTKKTIPNIDHIRKSKLTQAFPLIFVRSACAYLDHLTRKSALSDENLLAVCLLRNYLKTYLTGENGKSEEEEEDITHRRIRKTLNAAASYPDQTERCNLCDETINESWNASSCPRGHKLSRCTTTLLQITSLEYRVCPICGQVFHCCLNEIYEEPRCQLCDVPVLHNPYAFDTDRSKLYGTNLSRVSIAVSSSEPQEESQDPSEKRQTSKWRTSRTHPVTANDDTDNDDTDDNDDDNNGNECKIIEKWGEF